MSQDWIDDCKQWWGRVLDGPNAHWCVEWDDLPIDDTCIEAGCCDCIERSEEERAAIPECVRVTIQDPMGILD